MKLKNKTARSRTGAAVIEMAICLPVLVLLVWGTIETTQAIFLKQTLTSAAHEGALTGMRINATSGDVFDRVKSVLDSREVTGYRIEISPDGADFRQMESGDFFSIAISKGQQNSFINLTSVGIQVTSQRP